MCRAPAAGGTGGADLSGAGCLLAGVVEVPAGAVGAEGGDESELVPFVDSGAADAVPGGELPAGDGVGGARRAACGGDLVAGRPWLAGLVEAGAVVAGPGDRDQAQLGPAQDGGGGGAEPGCQFPAGEQVPAAFGFPCGGLLSGSGAVLAGVEQAFPASVGALAGDKAAPAPSADRLRGHLEVSGDLGGGEHACGAEPGGVRAQAARLAQCGQVRDGEGPAPAAGDSPAAQDRRDLVEGVLVQELADQLDGGGAGGVLLGGGQRPRQGQGVVLAAGEADLAADGAVTGPGEGDVGDEQAEQALAFPHGGGRVVPQGGEVAGQGQDAGLLVLIERGVGVAGAGVVLAGVGEFAQPGVPVGFQGAGYQPVAGVDGQVAALRGVGGVLGALHVGGADGVGLAGVGG